ncbi:MAG: sugar phosphate isomerase/epimerase [Chloroflexi bacterium]|nr:sugar phosphate isomerase/epimerase [Chloroflexota bacterium]MCL5273562.1 sugar phosphate isomerase/epimerase [Chloroflexota bacterium]
MSLKYAFMSFSCPQASLDDMLAMASRYGYDGIEPRVDAGHAHGIEPNMPAALRREIRHKIAQSGIPICCVATSCQYADPAATAAQLDLTRRCLDLAADIGAPRLRVFGGRLPAGISREQAIDTVARSLAEVAAYALERHVVICVETHDDWCDPRHMAEVMRRVDHPAIAVNWDIMHPVRQAGSTMDAAYQTLSPWIRHVHFHDGMLRLDDVELKPVGSGEIDHRRAVELLQQAGYDGYLSGEWIGWEPPEVHLPRELATMKSYES